MNKTSKCPFCNQLLHQKSIKSSITDICTNQNCQSHIFEIGNKVKLRKRPEIGIGTITDIRKDKEGIRYYIIKFKAYTQRRFYEQDIRHYIAPIDSKVKYNANQSNTTLRMEPEIRGDEIRIGSVIKQKLRTKTNNIHYKILDTDGNFRKISETQIVGFLEDPIEEYRKGEVDSGEKFLLRMWGQQIKNQYNSNTLKIITNSRLTILPYQVSVAHRLLMADNARFILADEVGLGKTIEAGIYLKEMIARNLAKRVLIIPPASLIGQWEFEMKNKFHLDFTRITSQKLKKWKISPRTGGFVNKKTRKQINLCIATLQYARLDSAQKITEIEWDIVIFDEAHHLRRYLENKKTNRYRTTLSYELGQKLSKKTKALLLLTATPIQLHSFDLFSLIELLNPYLFPDFQSFEYERKKISLYNLVVKNLRNFTRISQFERKSLVHQIMSLNLGYAESYLENKLKFGQVRKKIIHKVENKHFLSRFVIRNRRRNVFPDSKIKRVPRIVEVHLTDKELKLYNHIHLYLAKIYSENFYSGQSGVGFVMVILQKLLTSSPPALIKSLKKRIRYLNENKQRIVDLTTRANLEDELTAEDSSLDINEGLEDYTLDEKYEIRNRSSKIGEQRRSTEFNIEKHIKILSKFLSQLQKLHQLGIDSKAKKLVKIVKKILQHNPDEKMIIFTQFKQTLYYLAELLREEHIDVSEFHGSLTESQKDRNIHHFKTKGTVLMSTEIGGEGRNFQFCHIIINYDLPWNPMRLEQRIGRIDRIGQTKDVYIYNFFIADTVESSIINAISERIRIFEESIGDLEPILGSLEKKITEIVLKKDEVPTKFKVDELVGETQEKIEEVFDQLDDFILDKKSLQYQRISKDVINPKMISDVDLKHYFRLFSKSNPHLLNMEIQERENTNTYMLEVSGGLRSDLLLKKKSYEGLFDFDFAVQNDEYEFFALGHELLMKLVDLTTNDNYGGFSSNISLKWSQIKKYFSNIHPVNFPKQEKEILHKIKNQQKPLYLFIFQVRFLGVIVEKMIIPIIISHKKNILKMLSKLIYRPHNFSSILNPPLKNMEEKKDPDRQMDQRESIRSGSKEKLHELYEKAQNYIKPLIQEKTKNLVEENKKAYLKKKRKLKNLKRQKTRYIKDHIEWARNELRAKKIKLPTERQIRNANKIKNEKKKKKRFAYFENIRKDVEYYENEVKRWEKELEDLEFDIPAKLKKLKSYKQLKINADLFSFARIFIENQESI